MQIFFLLFFIEIDAKARKVSSIKPKSDDMHLIVHYFLYRIHTSIAVFMKLESCLLLVYLRKRLLCSRYISFSMNHSFSLLGLVKYQLGALKCYRSFIVQWLHLKTYSHLSNNSGGWNKRVGVQKLQNQLDFFHQFLC